MDEHPDLIGVALAGIGAGASAGAGVTTASWIVFKSFNVGGGEVVPRDQAFIWLTAGLFGGLIVAAMVAIALARAIPEVWRRGVTAAIAAFLAMMLGGASALVDAGVGTAGLIGYAALLGFAAFRAARRARRAEAGTSP